MKILLSFLLIVTATAVRAEKANDKSPLVTTEWLSKNLENPKVRIIEVSVEPGLYERGTFPGRRTLSGIRIWWTIPGATSFPRSNLRRWLRGWADPGDRGGPLW
jgi:hypothetical protein